MAEDTFGLWRMVDGDYENFLPAGKIPGPFTLYVTLHDGSLYSVGGYEVGIDIPAEMLILEIDFMGGTNFGDNTDHLVGYPLPMYIQTEIVVLAEMSCLSTTMPPAPTFVSHHASSIQSVPGLDGPVYANVNNPDELVPGGAVNGSPEVFLFGGVVATDTQTWSGVKALFE